MTVEVVADDWIPPGGRLCGLTSGTVELVGDKKILSRPSIGVFCSVRCPGKLILDTGDLAEMLARSGIAVVGGFQSSIEREFLIALLRGSGPVIVCPARTLHAVSVQTYRAALEQGRLLLLSPFESYERRMTRQTCDRRNRFVAALADRVFVSFADPDGMVERMCCDLLARQKPVFTFDSDFNRNILDRGAVGISCDEHGLSRLTEGLPDAG